MASLKKKKMIGNVYCREGLVVYTCEHGTRNMKEWGKSQVVYHQRLGKKICLLEEITYSIIIILWAPFIQHSFKLIYVIPQQAIRKENVLNQILNHLKLYENLYIIVVETYIHSNKNVRKRDWNG